MEDWAPEQSAFDDAHPIPDPLDAKVLLSLIHAVADTDVPPTRAWMQRLCASAESWSPSLAAPDACTALQRLAAAGFPAPAALLAQLLQPVAAAAAAGTLSTAQLSEALWSLSNLPGQGSEAGAATAQILGAAARRLPDFFAPDLARLVCAAGTLAAAPAAAAGPAEGPGANADAEPEPEAGPGPRSLGIDAAWVAKVMDECEYQVVEFPADFGAFDLARMALGLAQLSGLGTSGSGSSGAGPASGAGAAGSGAAWPEPSGRLRDALLKAVYARTRTIEEKAAVDYALARLDAKGKRSMHFDPRWTHEELNWLPRRERDKRRILKDGWYRTRWQGWRAD